MKNKKFTLIELIIAVIVISILASIVLVKILDMKNKSISAAVANNTKILQTAVDRYSLDNNGEYPIKNDLIVNLQNPRLINIELLKSKGYLKKELDVSKIKEQYYWLDVFGVAWGSTESTVDDISSVTSKDGKTRLEFLTPTGAVAYRVYEVTGYNKSETVTNPKDRHYKLVSEVELNKKRQKVNFEIPDNSKTYLISAIDKYEQETAPVGVFYKGSAAFEPLKKKDGTYTFEIDSFDEMFWVDFKTVEDKPGASTINYRFKVKDTDGVYGEWTSDFSSLPSSKAITVEIIMKGDADGNKPSLYDIRVMYRYAYEEVLPQPPVEFSDPEKPANICPAGATKSSMVNGKWIEGKPMTIAYLVNLPKGTSIDTIRNTTFYGYSIANVQYEYANEDDIYVVAAGTFEIPAGSCVNIIYTLEVDGKESSKGNPTEAPPPGSINEPGNVIVREPAFPDIITCKEKCAPLCEDCIPLCLENCVNHKEEELCKINECINPPICNEGDIGCTPPVCGSNCSEGPPTAPNPQDPELTDPDWITLETIRFFAHGPEGLPTRWIGMIPDHVIEEGKTRIVYRYAKSNGMYWSDEIDEINKVGESRSLMVVAYLQIHKDVKDNPTQNPPEILSIRILHEKGAIDLTTINPTVTILPVKDNNVGRDVFSDESVFDWKYVAVDPRGRKITDVEWSGDKRDKYPVGTYTVYIRVKNEAGNWSEVTPYKFDVLSEKPIANITKSSPFVLLNKNIVWSAAQSSDPDGDKIVKIEWRGDKQNIYTKEGSYTVGLRVQDSEGNWSDWVEEKLTVLDEGVKTQRLEAEAVKVGKVSHYKTNTTIGVGGSSTNLQTRLEIQSDTNASEGGKLYIEGMSHPTAPSQQYGSSVTFKFEGTGFNIKGGPASKLSITIDGSPYEKLNSTSEIYEVYRGLPEGEHTVVLEAKGTASHGVIDYIDVYNPNDDTEISNIKTYQIDRNGNETKVENNLILPLSNVKSKTYFTINKDAVVTVVVKDGNEIVKTLVSKTSLSGGTTDTHSIIWDGSNSSGSYLPTGTYTLEVTTVGILGKHKGIKTTSLQIEKNRPTLRLEAEVAHANSVVHYKTSVVQAGGGSPITLNSTLVAVTDSSKSNEKYLSIAGVTNPYSPSSVFPSYVDFTFEGDGYDLVLYDPKNTKVLLNGIEIKTLNQTGEVTLSERNITNKKHVLRVITTGNTQSVKIDYMDVYNSNDSINIIDADIYEVDTLGNRGLSGTNTIMAAMNTKIRNTFSFSKDGKASIHVVQGNKSFRTLWEDKDIVGGNLGGYSVDWDGKDNFGNFVATGNYTVVIKMEGVRNSLTETEIHVKIDAEQPIQRIEADSSATIKVKGTYTGSNGGGSSVTVTSKINTVDEPNRSGGKYVFMQGVEVTRVKVERSAELTFSFTGSGFDLSLTDPNLAKIYLQKGTEPMVLVNTITKTGDYTYSTRNLDPDNYKLKIVTTASAGKTYVDYLDIYK